MPCLVAAIGLIFPRVTMVLLVIFGDYLGRAYDTTLWPLLGFFFAPYSTLAYAFAMNHGGGLGGFHLVIFIIAVLIDLGVIGGSGHSASRSGRK